MMEKSKIRALEFTKQVKREILVMSKLKHPNVVRLNEVMRSDTRIYIVMELIPGGELFSRIGTVHDEREARKLFQQIVNGVDYCHRKGVAHRDLKAENILLDDNGNVKIADFGFSSFVGVNSATGLLYTQCGTPEYCAPEIISSGSQTGYDGMKADAWSIGIILYALLVGRLPFLAPTIERLFDLILNENVPKYPLNISMEAKDLLDKLLVKDPQMRYNLTMVKKHPWFLPAHIPHDEYHSWRTELTHGSSLNMEPRKDENFQHTSKVMQDPGSDSRLYLGDESYKTSEEDETVQSNKLSRKEEGIYGVGNEQKAIVTPTFPKILPLTKRKASGFNKKDEIPTTQRFQNSNNVSDKISPDRIGRYSTLERPQGFGFEVDTFHDHERDMGFNIDNRPSPKLTIPAHITQSPSELSHKGEKGYKVREKEIDGPISFPADEFGRRFSYQQPKSAVSYPYGGFQKERLEEQVVNNQAPSEKNFEPSEKYQSCRKTKEYSEELGKRLYDSVCRSLQNGNHSKYSNSSRMQAYIRSEYESLRFEVESMKSAEEKTEVFISFLSVFENNGLRQAEINEENNPINQKTGLADEIFDRTSVHSPSQSQVRSKNVSFSDEVNLSSGITKEKSARSIGTYSKTEKNYPQKQKNSDYDSNRSVHGETGTGLISPYYQYDHRYAWNYNVNVDFEKLQRMAVGEE